MIWEPFILALVLGIIVSAGLYFAYLWPSVEPVDPVDDDAVPSRDAPATPPSRGEPAAAVAAPASAADDTAGPPL